MFNLDFESEDLQFPCHPRFEAEAARIKSRIDLKSHFLLFSSGTTGGQLKGYALSNKALKINAEAVNHHFGLTKKDVWGLSLPHYHVGGLSVLARAHLTGSEVIDMGAWNPLDWMKRLTSVTVTTVVPTQVYDLIKLGLRAPLALRYLIVGGDFLSSELERQALNLGWPVIRTFGMTEVCSQLASAKKPGGHLQVLPIHEVKIEDTRLFIKSESLYTLQFKDDEILPAPQGWFATQDMARIDGDYLIPLGRLDDQIKASGKLISINELKDKLATYALKHDFYGRLELNTVPDERFGLRLQILTLGPEVPADIFGPVKFELVQTDCFKRTDLGKLKKS